MECKTWFDMMIDEIGESVKQLRENGVTDELVLVVSSWTYMNYFPAWSRVKEKTGVDYVEESEVGLPNDVEAMVMQRSEYLRMFIKELQRSVMENEGV